MTNKIGLIAVLTSASLVSACAADDPDRRAKMGAGIGAVVGAIVGNQADDDKGKYVGAVVGAIAGAAVGDYMDDQHAAMEKELKQEALRNEAQISRMSDGSLRINLASDVSFDVDSAELKFGGQQTFGKIAKVVKSYDKTVIHVVGHTDSSGSDAHNQALSERRADSVANFLVEKDVRQKRIRASGRGEREPIASNATADGKRRNRRVDIVIKPIVEGNEGAAEAPPPNLGA
jgi:outer membrane protein OmpA-like peptidoglycan-associated protein